MSGSNVVYTPELRARLSASAKRRCTPEYRAALAERLRSKLPKDEVQSLYDAGKPMREIGEHFGVSSSAVSRFMKFHNMRVGRNRDQFGSKNPGWKGENVSYTQHHNRVRQLRGTPQICEVCGSENDPKTIYDWANLTGKYEDPNDYKRMCRSCHSKYDDKFQHFKGIKPYTYRPRGKVTV